jgi:hypothetical protein
VGAILLTPYAEAEVELEKLEILTEPVLEVMELYQQL